MQDLATARPPIGWRTSVWRSLGRAISFLLYVAVFCLLAGAAVAKWQDFDKFHRVLSDSGLVTVDSAPAAAVLIIAAELLTAAGLLFTKTRTAALALVTGLGSLFFAYTVWRMFKGIGTPCPCFGKLLSLPPLESLSLSLALYGTGQGLLRQWVRQYNGGQS